MLFNSDESTKTCKLDPSTSFYFAQDDTTNYAKSSIKMFSKDYFVYIMASKRNGTLYIGITSNLIKRVYEHKNNFIAGFTKKYNCHTLVYYELHNESYVAIAREKQIKGWLRIKKLKLIENMNPNWNDLYLTL